MLRAAVEAHEQESEGSLLSTACKKWRSSIQQTVGKLILPTMNRMSIEMYTLVVKSADQTTVLANIMITAF